MTTHEDISHVKMFSFFLVVHINTLAYSQVQFYRCVNRALYTNTTRAGQTMALHIPSNRMIPGILRRRLFTYLISTDSTSQLHWLQRGTPLRLASWPQVPKCCTLIRHNEDRCCEYSR